MNHHDRRNLGFGDSRTRCENRMCFKWAYFMIWLPTPKGRLANKARMLASGNCGRCDRSKMIIRKTSSKNLNILNVSDLHGIHQMPALMTDIVSLYDYFKFYSYHSITIFKYATTSAFVLN